MEFSSIDVIGILGKRNCGKTYLSRKIQELFPRVVVIDVLHEYGREAGDPDSANVVRSFDDFARRLLASESQEKFRIIVQLDFAAPNTTLVAEEVIRLTYLRGSCLLVLEEVHYHATLHSMPVALQRALLTGKHRRLALIYTSQRPGVVHKTLISQCDRLYLGKMFEYNDVQYLVRVIGDEAWDLQNIPERQFLEIIPGTRKQYIKNDLTILGEMPSVKVVAESPNDTAENSTVQGEQIQ
jgi:hypothetical protein